MINSLRVIRAMINKEKTDILRNKKMLIIMFIFPVIYLFITFAGIQEFKRRFGFCINAFYHGSNTDNSINRGRGKGKRNF